MTDLQNAKYKIANPVYTSSLSSVSSGSKCLVDGRIMTNYPLDGDFQRSTFHPLRFKYDRKTSGECSISNVYLPGTFEFYTEYVEFGKSCRSSSGYFQIPPTLLNLPRLDSIVMKTFVPKWLGTIDNWMPLIEETKKLGYNMIHFSPPQQRGESNSPYSIYDQLEFDSGLFSSKKSKAEKNVIVGDLVRKMEQDFQISSIVDVVWNHTANNSEWLKNHPESGYNLDNSPHLKVAYELDEAILQFSVQLDDYKLLPNIKTEEDLLKIIKVFKEKHLPKYKLWEYFVLDVNECLRNQRFIKHSLSQEHAVKLCLDALYQTPDKGRNSWRVKSEVLEQLESSAFAKEVLDIVNLELYKKLDKDIEQICSNIINRVKFERLADHGPKLGPITKDTPLVYSYFTRIPKANLSPGEIKVHALVNNGWIWNADPLVNFANSNSYFMREVIVWGDCVKLRYGSKPEDNPWLWSHMKEYTELMAKLYHGFRIDNCHSTPIHVAQYLLDAARKIRPNLYVVAELFTGSEELDTHFVCKLGINSLIREAIVCWDSAEQSRQIHRYGGQPVGSFHVCLENRNFAQTEELDSVELLAERSSPHALFMECTHDNETPYQKRTAKDALPHSALTAFTASAFGSVHGYDDLYPYLLDLVKESRVYGKPENFPTVADVNTPFVPSNFKHIKAYLLKLHRFLSDNFYSEVYVHRDWDLIRVVRDNPVTHHGFFVIAHCAFKNSVEPIRIRGNVLKLITGATLIVETDYKKNEAILTGFGSSLLTNTEAMFNLNYGSDSNGEYVDIILKQFPPGSVLIFEKSIQERSIQSLAEIHSVLTAKYPTNKTLELSKCIQSLDSCLEGVDLLDLNVLLYRSNSEERDSTEHGAYNIPDYGEIAYCGLQAFVSIMKWIAKENNLGHPFCHHLRHGPWALSYCYERLERQLNDYPRLKPAAEWLKKVLNLVKQLPFYLWPKYFYFALIAMYQSAIKRAFSIMSEFVRKGDNFVHSLALGTVQMYGNVKSTGLTPYYPHSPCLAAGLPHFAVGFMRCWGRDVFISLRGVFLLTGRFNEAREHIIAFASVVKHGLIPNLLDAGRKPRYNARDAVWFCLQAIQDYCKVSPEGLEFLQCSFKRRFATDEFTSLDDPRSYYSSMTIEEFIFHVLQRHAEGIHFREWNAGPDLDRVMTNQGFQIDIETDTRTGLIFGGNPWNCGTWMDKMGESSLAGTTGKPATARDGAAVEICGLLKSTLRWINELLEQKKFKYDGVQVRGRLFSFKEWDRTLQDNFEKYFFVPVDPLDDGKYHIDSSIVNKRGMYKDTFMSSTPFRDYQLRPNFCIAYVVAPELFKEENIRHAIKLAAEHLAGPIGMKTLDPADWEYRGDYQNDSETVDPATSKGFNYHQGPEWVWVFGYFLRAFLKANRGEQAEHLLQRYLMNHRVLMKESIYAGLPELTNSNGSECRNSCATQAWSMGTILEALYELEQE